MREKFLAVFDGTDECKSAVRYAARRAQLNNANLMIVATVAVSYTHLTLPTTD